MEKETKTLKKASRPGPKPKVLRLREDYKKAIKLSLTKRKPPEGWPK